MNKKIIISLIVILPLITAGVFYLPKWENFPLAAAIGSFFQFSDKETETSKLLEEIKSELERLQEEISLLEERLETEQEARIELELKYESELTSLSAQFDKLVKIVDSLGRQTKTISQTEELEEEFIEEETEKELEQKINQEIILCQKREGDFPKRNKVIFNEIAWMGSANSANDEWIELKNISGSPINLAGWQILNKEKRIKIVFATATIPINGFFLLERTSDDSVPGASADLIFTGALKNSDEALYLLDENCQLQDEVLANPDWPAGDNSSRRTMERRADLIWQTSANPGGTPKRENSSGYIAQQTSNTPTTSGPSSRPQPQIFLSIPQNNPVNKEIEATLSVSNLKDSTYDIKILIEKEDVILSQIYNQKENKWQSSLYYLKEVFSGQSFTGKFRLKIREEKNDFREKADIIVRVRESGKTNYYEFVGEINIIEPEPEPEPESGFDTTPPQVIFNLNLIQITSCFEISFEITDSALGTVSPSGLDGFVFRWKEESGDWQEDNYQKIEGASLVYVGEKEFSGEDEKIYYFQIKAKDKAGNENDWLPEIPVFTKISVPKIVLISEVYYDTGRTIGGVKEEEYDNEWVEIYNLNNFLVNISGWKICDNSSCATISTPDPIPAYGLAVITAKSSTWSFWEIPPQVVKIVLGIRIGNGLSNTGDRIILKRQDDSEVDAVSWGTDNYAFEGANLLKTGDGKSIARVSKEIDKNLASDWRILDLPAPGQ